MKFPRTLAAGALSAVTLMSSPAASQPCVTGTAPYRVDDIKRSVFIISPASNLNSVLGTATYVHRDGLFITAAHTMMDVDPTTLVLHRPGTGSAFKTSFKPASIVYPAAGPCADASSEKNRCRYRGAEKRVLESMPPNDSAWKDNLDFALLKADIIPPSTIKPVPLRRSGFAEDNVKFWGFPGDPSLGAPGYDLRTVDARYTGRAGGIPLYRTDLYASGLSGSLALDGRGRGFGVIRKRKGDASAISLDDGYDLPIAEDANLMVVVPFDPFVKAGLFDGYSAPRLQHFINLILNGIKDDVANRTTYVSDQSVLQKLQLDIEAEPWTIFDYLQLGEVENQIRKLGPNAWGQKLALMSLPFYVAATTCEPEAKAVYAERAVNLLESPDMRALLASGDFEARSAVIGLASAADWGAAIGAESDVGKRFALASVKALYEGSLTPDVTREQRKLIAEAGIAANASVGNWGIWTSETQPALLAAQTNPAAYVWDRVGYWHLGQGDAASAALSFLKTEKQLDAAAELSPDSDSIKKFRAITIGNYKYAIDQLARDPNADKVALAKLDKDSVTLKDFVGLADGTTISIALDR